ncbi:MAG TPA: hypothetical protein VJK54_08845, partial [Chthoniobacterales bacterium]|nr:hypothetical protein [Chthoniobacterales bacterium]
MKKILPITAFSSLMSMQCIFAQVTPAIPTQIRQVENRLEIEDANQTTDYKIQLAGCTKIKPQSEDLSFKIEHRAKNTTNYELQTTNCDNSAGSLNCHLMMNPSSAEEGIQAVHKAFGTSEQSAIAVEGSPLGHQAMAVVPETRMTPKVSVRAESSEIEEGMFSSPSNQVLRLREGGPKTKNRPTGGLKYTGDTSEEESDRDDVDPDLESENLPSRSPEGVQSMDSQVNKYLKNEIINNIYTECLAEVAKLTLNGRVAAENYSLEEAEWKIAESAAKHYIGDCESDLRIFERESAEAQEISKKAQEHAQAVEFDSKKGNDSNQVIAFVIACQKARVAYAESDYKVKKCAVQLAEARLRAANTTLWAIEVRKHSSRDAIDKKLAERQKIEADALDAFTKAKGDLETKAALLSAAEDAIAAVKKSSSTGTKSSTNRGAALTENMKASKEAGSISEASIMRPIEPPVLSDDIAEKIGKALLEGKGKITIEPIENSENEEENRERWELRRKADESYNKAQRAWQGYKNRSSSIDSVISDVSFNTAQNEDTFYKQDEKDWEELAKKAEKRLFPEKSVDDPILLKELLKKWKQKDRTAVMKKYCHDNTPRWIARAKADAAENNYRIVVKETESFSADAEIARRNRDVTEKEWSDLADQEESVIQAQEDVSSAQKELKQSDQAANKLLEMIQKQDQGVSGISQNSEGQQESDPEVYFQTSGEEEALECYTRDVIGKARRDALESVLKNNSSFVEQLWNDRVMEARKAVNNAKKEAQKKTAKRKKKIENALRKGVDAFNDEVKRLSGIQAVWMARLEEAAQSHADGNTTVWDKLTEEERNAYNAITFVRNKVKGEAIQKDLEKAKKALKEAQEKADTTWFNKKAALEEVEKAEAELKKLEVAEAERQKVIQEAIQWAKLTPKERSIKKAQEYAEIARKKLQLVQDRDKIFQAAMNSDNARQEIAWHCAIDSYDKTGLRFKKAIAVEKIEGSSLFAELWSKIAVRYQESAEYFRKAAETQLNGNDTEVEEVDRRWEAGASYKSSAWSLESAAEALEKATVETAEGDAFLAELWNKIVMQYHELAEHYRKAAEAYSSGNDTGAKQWKKAADSAKNSALVLESAAKAPEKATAATAKGNLSFAELWSKLAVQHQELAEYYRKAAEATLSGNDKEVDRWEEAGASYKSSAWSLESAAEALEKATAATAE